MDSQLSKGEISRILDKISRATSEGELRRIMDYMNRLIRWWSKDICVESLPNHVVLGGVTYLVNHGCVESLSSSDSWMAGPVRSNSRTKSGQGWSVVSGLKHIWFEGCCTIFKDFDSRLSADEWNRKATEKIILQKNVHVSVQALEQVRDFNSKVVLLISSRGVTRYEVT
ncbi:hypothetical protein YC2023_099682 [Brassica napus]